MTKSILKKKECKKAKCLSGEALQIAEERREVKGRGEFSIALGYRLTESNFS